jgi:catalase
LVNHEGKRSFVKFHWIPQAGTHSLVWDEALKLAGQDPDFHRRDLYEAIDVSPQPTIQQPPSTSTTPGSRGIARRALLS